MDSQQRNTLEQYKPALKLAGKAAGWAMLLPALAVYWLFMLVFKLAGATFNWVATSDGWTEDDDVDTLEDSQVWYSGSPLCRSEDPMRYDAYHGE